MSTSEWGALEHTQGGSVSNQSNPRHLTNIGGGRSFSSRFLSPSGGCSACAIVPSQRWIVVLECEDLRNRKENALEVPVSDQNIYISQIQKKKTPSPAPSLR